jgi:pimeloyl-ACP methyl ester carboxylesterase
VLFFHWLGEPKGDRSEFLDEAMGLAKYGAVSLLIQGYFPWAEPFTEVEADRQRIRQQTIEVRRAMDLLLSQAGVDPKRVGYVGHDYGAMYGSIVAGLEKRARTYILIAGMGTFSDWSLKYWPATAAKGDEVYRRNMDTLDPAHYISRAAPASLLFQFANSDKYISKATATAFYEAASKPKQVEWYDTDHYLNIEAARNDRRVWLTRQLGLAKAN